MKNGLHFWRPFFYAVSVLTPSRAAALNQVRIPRPLTSNRAQPMYNTMVATSMKVIAMLIRMSETPRMP